MAKGSYRLKRARVLEELRELDPVWAGQLDDLRSTEPQAYRKEMLKVDAWISAKVGRPTTLSMRRKRFGGDEDPALVRRVQELRKHAKDVTRGFEHAAVIGQHTPPAEALNVPPAEGQPIPATAPERRGEPFDASVLAGSAATIKKALSGGEFDGSLDALEGAERVGKSRKSVLSAIAARRSALST